MFYNTENLFDSFNDSLTNDDAFTPSGEMHWTFERFRNKINNIAKVIVAVGEWNPPEIIGLCEIENRYVLEYLVAKSPLSKFHYKIIHKESPDERGIDVAFLYHPQKFKPLYYKAIQIVFPGDSTNRTRDILCVNGIVNNDDTIHFFINHLPSKKGGQYETTLFRNYVMSILKEQTDLIFQNNHKAKIIIMGDFNENCSHDIFTMTLGVKNSITNVQNGNLYNLNSLIKKKLVQGTYKFQDTWEEIDQFIVSGSLLDTLQNVRINLACIFENDFVLTKEENSIGYKPFRTFSGMRYSGGYSDHLPIFLDLSLP